MDSRIEPLDRLVVWLENLLSLLDEAGAHTMDAIDNAWRRCTETFEQFQEIDGERGPPHAAYPEEVRERAEEALRLYAIAGTLTTRLKEGLVVEKEHLSRAHAHLDSLTRNEMPGGSCDMSG